MAPSPTQSIGAKAEQLALEFLTAKGLRCLQRNFFCRFGEIDLIMQDGDCLIFVEVRFRSRNRFSTALQSVGIAKQRKIIRSASSFLRRAKRYSDTTIRFDVVAIDSAGTDDYAIQWVPDAFRPGY